MIHLWFAGCASYPLPLVPVTGGTAEERAYVRSTVEVFDDAVGPGRVELRAIEIDPEGRHFAHYEHATRTIQVRLDSWPIGTVIRHELCHALVEQQHLEDASPDPIDAAIPMLDQDRLFDEAEPW